MQPREQMKRRGSLGMKAVLALETLAPAYFRLSPRNVYFRRSRTWITFTRRPRLDYLQHNDTAEGFKIPAFMCIRTQVQKWHLNFIHWWEKRRSPAWTQQRRRGDGVQLPEVWTHVSHVYFTLITSVCLGTENLASITLGRRIIFRVKLSWSPRQTYL